MDTPLPQVVLPSRNLPPEEQDNTTVAPFPRHHVDDDNEFGDGRNDDDDISCHFSDADDEDPPASVATVATVATIATVTTPTTTKKKTGGGRVTHVCWEFLSDEIGQHRVSETRCKNCTMVVRHHKKSEKVIGHLNICREFRHKMADLPSIDVPSWVTIQGRQATPAGGRATTYNKSAKRKFHDVASTQDSMSSTIATSSPITLAPTGNIDSSKFAIAPRTKQRKMRDYVLPLMSPSDHAAFQANLAMHIYMTATSFVRVEEHHLLLAFQKLRPDVSLPSRRDLSGKLLNNAHRQVKEKVDTWLTRDLFACITSDAWSNVKNESVINYMLVSGDISLFLESKQTGEEAHTSAFLAADIRRVIISTNGKVSGAIMDNTSANKRAWTLLKALHPDKFFQGCVAHGLHLLVKDTFAATKTKRNRVGDAQYPDLYPFENLLTFTSECRKVVRFFHNHHAPKHQLMVALRWAGLKQLAAMAPTRWGSLINMSKSLLAAEEVLLQLVSSRDFVTGTLVQKAERQTILSLIGNPTFVPNLTKIIEILSPIDIAIVYYQSDKVPISEVFRTFQSKLSASINAMTLINEPERQYLLNLVTKRMGFMYGDAHGIAYVLDPRYLGMDMTPDQRMEVEEIIYSHPTLGRDSTANLQDTMVVEYTNFRIAALEMRQSGSRLFRSLTAKSISVLMFWMSHGDPWPNLQILAKQVFSMVASSAASERNFSAFAFVHTKQRNCLSEASVEKLVYIRTNNLQFTKQQGVAAAFSNDDDITCSDDDY